MNAIYSLRTIPSGWQVTKFDSDFNVESSYEMTQSDGQVRCGCPAGARPTCRHRQMFPMLQLRVDTAWMLDFDTRQWVDPTGAASEASSTGLDDSEMTTSEMRDGLEKDELVIPQRTVLEESQVQSEPITRLDESHPFRRRM